jgi:hypothetical protein
MALTRAPQGGGDGLDFDDVKQAMQALAKAGDLVVFRVLEVHEPVQMTGEVHPVTADMVVCSGKSKGKTLLGFRHIGRGITGPLRKAAAGGDREVAARLELKSGVQKWIAAQTPSDADYAVIEKFYGDGKAVWNGEPLVELPDQAPANGLVRAGAGSDEDQPPF